MGVMKTKGVIEQAISDLCHNHGRTQAQPKVGGRTPGENKFNVKFRRKSRPHPLEFFVRTHWNFSTTPLKFSSSPLR
ncbi:hypothetical protein Hanom_Chr17g01577691 [Helianthus anomalus]